MAVVVAAISAVGAIVAAYISAQSKPESPLPPTPSNISMTPTTTQPAQHAMTTDPPVPTRPVVTTETTVTAGGVPEGYQGTWSGSLTLAVGNTAETHPFIYQIGPGRAGEVVGTFQQPQCAGQVVYESGTGPIQFTDQVTNNPYNWCAPSTLARAVLVDSKTLSISLFSGDVVVGQGVLSKP
ncbi:MAG: hypothetical protein ACRDTC_08490 [Pseudonocardiaceae bacterium]